MKDVPTQQPSPQRRGGGHRSCGGMGQRVLQNWGCLYRLSSCRPLWRVRPCFISRPPPPHPPQARLKSFSAKIVQLLKEWTEAFPYDFQDEKAMAELKAITHRVTQCDEVRSSSEPGRVPCLREGWVFRDSSVCGPLCCHSPKRTAGWLHLPLSPTRATQLASNRPDLPLASCAHGRPCGPSGVIPGPTFSRSLGGWSGGLARGLVRLSWLPAPAWSAALRRALQRGWSCHRPPSWEPGLRVLGTFCLPEGSKPRESGAEPGLLPPREGRLLALEEALPASLVPTVGPSYGGKATRSSSAGRHPESHAFHTQKPSPGLQLPSPQDGCGVTLPCSPRWSPHCAPLCRQRPKCSWQVWVGDVGSKLDASLEMRWVPPARCRSCCQPRPAPSPPPPLPGEWHGEEGHRPNDAEPAAVPGCPEPASGAA